MNGYRWTVRVALSGVGLLATWAAFAAVVGIFNVVIAGVYPEAWVLIATMTAPVTIGLVSIATIVTALIETVSRRRKSTVG